jgi:hypothetical protein
MSDKDLMPNYHMIRIFRNMRRFAMKEKNMTVAEYDQWLKSQVDEAIGEPPLAAVPRMQRHE